MNYDRPELLDQLAAAYALGSLRGRARARFERLCSTLPAALAARMHWEDRLLPLALAAPPAAPRAESWSAIRSRLAALDGAHAARPPRSLWRWAVAASVVAVVLLAGRLTIWKAPEWQLLAELAPANSATQWRVERTADSSQIAIRTVGPVTAAAATSFELWVLPGGGANPVSLGIMPTTGAAERKLTQQQRTQLRMSMQVAVSVEPAGGSPSGLPTGPVIIVAPIVAARSTA
jgi:anti-sigma-K factor RskA